MSVNNRNLITAPSNPSFCVPDHMVHGAISILHPGDHGGESRHVGGGGHRPPLLRNSPFRGVINSRSMDGRSLSDILRLQHRMRGASCSRFL